MEELTIDELYDLLDILGAIIEPDDGTVEIDLTILEEQTEEDLLRNEYLPVLEIW